MTNFVFLHGSFHAAWNWHKVLPILERMGHRGIALDMPGHGLDSTPSGQVTLDMCVERVSHALAQLPGRAVLVAHSRNGIVASQAAERQPERILGLVYLAAYLVPNGRSMMDYAMLDRESLVVRNVVPRTSKRALRMLCSMTRTAVGRSLLQLGLPGPLRSHSLPRAVHKAALYHDCPDEITELAHTLLQAEPTLPGFTPLKLSEANYGRVPKIYIECTQDRAVTHPLQQRMLADSRCDRVFCLHTSHSPFFSCPERLAELLTESLDTFREARARNVTGTAVLSGQRAAQVPSHSLDSV